ncbi:hypothetical protein JCM6882_006382 [Rhodosporidiobolus microsporus]
MATQGSLVPLLRSLTLRRTASCACTRSLAAPLAPARPFSTSLSRLEQAPRDRESGARASEKASALPKRPSQRNDRSPSQLRQSSPSSRTRPSTFSKRPRKPRDRSDPPSFPAVDPSRRLALRRQDKEENRLRKEAEMWAQALELKRTSLEPVAEQPAKSPVAPRKDKEKALPAWKRHKVALQSKFPTGWAPPKRISREAMDLVRTLARSDPARYTTPMLAAKFKISPEAVSKILKSRFELPKDEREKREARRKEMRAQGIREGAAAGAGEAQVWEGDSGAQKREMDDLRRRRQRELDEGQ